MVSTIEDEEYKSSKFGFWEDVYCSLLISIKNKKVYGLRMPSIEKWARVEPVVDIVEKGAINSESCAVFVNNLQNTLLLKF